MPLKQPKNHQNFRKIPPLLTLIKAYLPSLLWAGLIFVLSSQSVLPGPTGPALHFISRKLAHISVYGILYWLLFWGTKQITTEKQFTMRHFLPLFLTLLYALSDELHQSFVPGRYGTLRDVGYDALGVWIVYLRSWRVI